MFTQLEDIIKYYDIDSNSINWRKNTTFPNVSCIVLAEVSIPQDEIEMQKSTKQFSFLDQGLAQHCVYTEEYKLLKFSTRWYSKIPENVRFCHNLTMNHIGMECFSSKHRKYDIDKHIKLYGPEYNKRTFFNYTLNRDFAIKNLDSYLGCYFEIGPVKNKLVLNSYILNGGERAFNASLIDTNNKVHFIRIKRWSYIDFNCPIKFISGFSAFSTYPYIPTKAETLTV